MNDLLNHEAKVLWLLGNPIVLLTVKPNGDKIINMKWEQWKTNKQTETEFNALPWDDPEINAIAVVCGHEMVNGLYFGVIDIDREDFDLCQPKTTLIEKTVRARWHFVYHSRKPVPFLEAKKLNLELRGVNHLCIMYPSAGYQRWNDNLPTVVDDLEAEFRALSGKLGGSVSTKARQPLTKVLQPQPEGNRNQAIFDLAAALRDKNVPYETALVTALATAEKYDKGKEPFTQDEIKATVQSAYEHPLKEKGEKTVTPVTTQDTPWPEIPPPQPYGDSTQLTADIIEFLKPYIELQKEEQYLVIAEYIKATWIVELFETVPYLRFLGPPDSGKTRGTDLNFLLTYKPIYGPSFTESVVFRAVDKWHPTIILDETDTLANIKNPNTQATIAILNAGYRRGQKAYRSEFNPETGKYEPVGYDVFGFKILAGTKVLADTIERRCIPIIMQRNKAKKKRVIDKEAARTIRGKLHQYRLDSISNSSNRVNAFLEVLYNKEPSCEEEKNLEVTDGTILELYSPLVYTSLLAVNSVNSVRNAEESPYEPTANTVKLYSFMFEQQIEKHASETTSFDADIVRAVLKAPKEVGKFRTRQVADHFNFSRKEDEQWKTATVGHNLRKLGFISAVLPDSSRGYFYNLRLVQQLCKRYDIPFEEKVDERPLNDFQQISDKTFWGSVSFNLRKLAPGGD